jgi:hypothetical protein
MMAAAKRRAAATVKAGADAGETVVGTDSAVVGDCVETQGALRPPSG